MTQDPIMTVAIVGGGFSGAVVAHTLAQHPGAQGLKIIVVEPRAQLGSGLAYSTCDPAHRINVPHSKMSIRTDDMGHFGRWLATRPLPPHAMMPDGQIFAPRALFGAYVAETLAPFLADGRIRHLRTKAEDIQPDGQRFQISLGDGSTLTADAVVLALSHPASVVPAQLQALATSEALVNDPFAPRAFDRVEPGDRVLIVGSGLTSADILATLDRRGHSGSIHVISRHGWRSRPHAPQQVETGEDFTVHPETTALGLLRRVRRVLAVDARNGLTWHAAFDRLRAQGPAIWAALPLHERGRFLRHLRGLWDVHRFRIAPQPYEVQERLIQSGQARFLVGKLQGVGPTPAGLCVTWRKRGHDRLAELMVDRIILATGPDHARITETNPLLRRMTVAGLIAADPLRLGLHTAPGGEAIGSGGHPSARLYVAGPLARATVGELMGLPEVTTWAEFLAGRCVDLLADGRPLPAV